MKSRNDTAENHGLLNTAPCQNHYEIAEDEAATWAILLADAPGDNGLQTRFDAWLQAGPINAAAWERTQRAWKGLGQLDATTRDTWPDSSGNPLPSHLAAPSSAASAQRRHQWRTLTGLAIAGCLLLMILPTLKRHLAADYITGSGEQRTLTLADNSHVYLAPESALAVNYDDRARRVTLLTGQAFFRVTPNSRRPFIVTAETTRTTVLGTAFGVERRDNGTRVTVAHGRVKVTDGSSDTNQTLTAGDRLTMTWNDKALLTHIAPAEVASWRRGVLIVRHQTIGQVVDALRPYLYGIVIVTGDFAQRRVTGLYHLDDPTSTLKKLVHTQGGRVRQISPWVLIVSR